MQPKHVCILFVATIGLLCASPLLAQEPISTAFTYQGQLKEAGVPADEDYDFLFKLFEAETGGAQVGGDVQIEDWPVLDGLFTVQLDFGEGVFAGDALWLEVGVRLGVSGDPHTVLSPRQPLAATPYALYALSGPGSGGFWAANGDDIYNTNSGQVGIGTTSPSYPLHVVSADADAVYGENTASSGVGVYGKASSFEGGGFGLRGDTYGTTGIGVFGIAAMTAGNNCGVYGQSQSQTGRGVYGLANNAAGVNYGVYGVTNSPDGWAGYFQGRGYFSGNVGIGTDAPDHALDVAGRAFMDTLKDVGWIGTRGPNGQLNTQTTHVLNYPNNGLITVADSTGMTRAAMYVQGTSTGVISADIKNFRVPNPSQPGTDIWYACVEGPEAAAYVRGTAHLVNGRATVTFPDHFTAVATSQGMTVQITPHSAESKGLAVVERSIEGFVVRELFSGAGTYDFDYTVMAVRQGHEDYRVIRPNTEGLPAGEIEAGKPGDADRIADTEVR